MTVSPYLFFNGRCQEAIDFYKRALGAEVSTLMRFRDAPPEAQRSMQPENADKVMHADLKIAGATVLMSDGRGSGTLAFEGFALCVEPRSRDEAERLFTAISDGGEVRMPMAETFFSPGFGMAADRFGVGWIVVTQRE
jgi:PhnB protein